MRVMLDDMDLASVISMGMDGREERSLGKL